MANYKHTRILHIADAAYIAGIIDGDGTITLSRRHKNENRQLVISISNNEKRMLDYIVETTGVGTLTKKCTYNAKHAINFTYKVSNRQALDLLQNITPYLKTHKRDRALLILEKYLKLTPRNGKYTQLLSTEREKFISDFFKITADNKY